jgi:hypothetical protein
MNEQLRKYLTDKGIHPLTTRREIPRNYFLTGTRAYGPARDDSDYDVVVLYSWGHYIQGFLHWLEIPFEMVHDNPAYSSFYLTVRNRRINFVQAHNNTDFEVWFWATMLMRLNPPIEDRETRIETFQTLRQELEKLI